MGRVIQRMAAAAAACACAAAVAGAVPAAGAAGATRATGHPRRQIPLSGTVYVESNSVAPGSNEILAFRYRGGVLSARGVRRSPTGGSGSHDLSDSGVLDADQPANYTSFHVRADGSLSGPISSIDVPPGSSPLQAYVTPDRRVLITSEETGVFRAFRIGPGGTLTEGRGSPLRLAKAVFPGGRRVPDVWPAGLASNPRLKILGTNPIGLAIAPDRRG